MAKKTIDPLIKTQRAVVIVYDGKELSEIGEKLIVDYLFDNAHATNITVHRLDVCDLAKTAANAAMQVRHDVCNEPEPEKTPLQHALTYIGEKFDTSSSLSNFIIHLVNAVRREEFDPEEKLKKALSIISAYDDSHQRETLPEYKKYGFKHAHLDALKNIYKHFA